MNQFLQGLLIFGGFLATVYYIIDKLMSHRHQAKIYDLDKIIAERKAKLAAQEEKAKSSLEEYEKLKKDYDSSRSSDGDDPGDDAS